MENEHREILRRNRPDLVKDLEPLKLLNDLAECLDEDDRDAVKSISGRKSQAEELLDLIPRKGPRAFECFVGALYKRQEHLARPLIEQAGIDISNFLKDDVGMSSKHKQILLGNVGFLHDMNLKDMVPRLHSAHLLDDIDRENLLSDARPASQSVEMLLTDVLPRKGPTAFKSFVEELYSVHPEMGNKLLKDAGIEGSFDDERSPTPVPIQDTGSFELDSLVQDVLDVKPECLKQFCQLMDEDDVWGNGWKRLYRELNLPSGKEAKMKGRDGGPALNCIKGWISLKGRSATVKALLIAGNHAERKDCVVTLEKSLGCQMDDLDGPANEVTRNMDSLTCREERRRKFFGDLDEKEASQIIDRLQQESRAFLRDKLIKALGADAAANTMMLIQQNKKYPIREFTDLLKDEQLMIREDVIKTFREVLNAYKGVTGPLLPPNEYVRNMTFTQRRVLTTDLSGNDSWMVLAQRLGMDNAQIAFLNERYKNPAEEVLRFWEVKSGSTVGNLYNILVELEYPYMADLL